jgi:hypothetical protein
VLPKEIRNRTNQSGSRKLFALSEGSPGKKPTMAGWVRSGTALEASAGIGVMALCASVFYRVRELLAAFILFRVVCAAVAIAVLILWLVERGTHMFAVRLETQVDRFRVRHGFASSPAHSNSTLRTPSWN